MRKSCCFLLLAAMIVVSLGGCNGGAGEDIAQGKAEVLSFESAKSVEPQLVSTDELVKLVVEDTTHWKVVYFFDAVCKPCREHLQKELREMYARHDTTQWRFYLVAGFNWLHVLTPDEEGNLVEDTLGTIKHYAEKYSKWLPSLGYDMKDVYFHYDPTWEHTETGVFTPLAKRMFVVKPSSIEIDEKSSNCAVNEEIPFRCKMEGMPQLFKADRHNRLQMNLCAPLSDTLKLAYVPNNDYNLDTMEFYQLKKLLYEVTGGR